jgi:hypothetical protein
VTRDSALRWIVDVLNELAPEPHGTYEVDGGMIVLRRQSLAGEERPEIPVVHAAALAHWLVCQDREKRGDNQVRWAADALSRFRYRGKSWVAVRDLEAGMRVEYSHRKGIEPADAIAIAEAFCRRELLEALK